MKKHKSFSFINITGLAIGMACFMIIMLWVQDEFSYDKFHEKADHIYRVAWKVSGDEKYSVATPAPLADVLKDECPEIINSTRLYMPQDILFKYKEQQFEEKVFFADSRFFEIFTFPFIHGNPETALDEPSSIICTEDMAKKYFPEENPIGNVLTLKLSDMEEYDLIVTGIIKNIPRNSHLQTNSFISLNFWTILRNRNHWSDYYTKTYLLIRENQKIEPVKENIGKCIQKYMNEGRQANPQVFLQPLKKVHLYSDFLWDISGHGDIKYVYLFSVIALFILIIACINFMNLSTARSIKRAREIGLRKVVGANRIKIIFQFLGESFFYILFAFIISIILVEMFLPHLGEWTGKKLAVDYFNGRFITGAIVIGFLTGMIAAGYPAFFLSSFEPVKTLKQNRNAASKGNILRKMLIALQFSLSIIIIIGSMVVSNQLTYIRNANLGYNKENLISIRMRDGMGVKYETVKRDLMQNPNVISATANEFGNIQGTNSISWEGKKANENVNVQVYRVDYDFLKTVNVEMMKGRFYSKEFTTDATEAYVINEAAVKAMDIKSPIGKQFQLWGYRGKIIGVIKDFHFKSLHDEIEPLILWPNTEKNFGNFEHLTVRIKSDDIFNTIRSIENIWKKHSPDYPFEYQFFDETIDTQYRFEQRVSKIFNMFTVLAIFISCMGLLGLVCLFTEQKTKEIGVRKVLGATDSGIVVMLSKDFAKWILLANIIAWPIAFYAMNKWLQNFAYRIDLTIWPFLLSALLALLIALFTVSWQAVRAARANPVESLRYE